MNRLVTVLALMWVIELSNTLTRTKCGIFFIILCITAGCSSTKQHPVWGYWSTHAVGSDKAGKRIIELRKSEIFIYDNFEPYALWVHLRRGKFKEKDNSMQVSIKEFYGFSTNIGRVVAIRINCQDDRVYNYSDDRLIFVQSDTSIIFHKANDRDVALLQYFKDLPFKNIKRNTARMTKCKKNQ